MTYDLVVYLKKCQMPTPIQWREEVFEMGFPVRLDHDFDPDSFTGFLPCHVFGAQSGFEFYTSPVSWLDRQELLLPPEVDYAVQFLTVRGPLGIACVLAAASVLARMAEGCIDSPDSGKVIAGNHCVDWAKAELRALCASTYDVASRL